MVLVPAIVFGTGDCVRESAKIFSFLIYLHLKKKIYLYFYIFKTLLL